MLAATLKGAVSQRLVPTRDGKGRIAASEILVVTGRIQDLILNPAETGKISQVIAEGGFYGMQTFDQSLLGHVQSGVIDERTAMEYATSPHDFKLMIASAGHSASDMSQIGGSDAPAAPAAAEGDEYAEIRGAAQGAPEPPPPAREPTPSVVRRPPPETGGEHGAEPDYGSPEHAYGGPPGAPPTPGQG